jgi:hypothetical protein
MNDNENNDILFVSPINPIRDIEYEYYYEDNEMSNLIKNLSNMFEIPISAQEANFMSFLASHIINLFNDPQFVSMMNTFTDQFINYSGVLLQDIYITNKQLENSLDENINCDLNTLDSMISNINKAISYYNIIDININKIKGHYHNVKERLINLYNSMICNTYIQKINNLSDWIKDLRNYEISHLKEINYNTNFMRDRIIEKIQLGWDINRGIYNIVMERLNTKFGIYIHTIITTTAICKDKIRLNLNNVRPFIEMFSIYSFIESNINMIKLSENIHIFQKFKRFLN